MNVSARLGSESGHVENYDGGAWPLPEGAFSHPRSNGTFAKILRSYVRERGLMSLSEAIRKMSLIPAQTLEGFVPQMKKKGSADAPGQWSAGRGKW